MVHTCCFLVITYIKIETAVGGDENKVLAVLPGGVSGRLFDSHHKDQIEPFTEGDTVYWWFSDKAIEAHTKAALILKPG